MGGWPPNADRTLTDAELAAAADVDLDVVRELAAMGLLARLAPGSHEPGDVARVRTAAALIEAGIDLDALRWTTEHWDTGFETLGRVYAAPAPLSERTYADFAASLGDAATLLPSVWIAFGLPEPAAHDHLSEDEERIVGGFVGIWSQARGATDVAARAALLASDGIRRMTEGWIRLIEEGGLTPLRTDRDGPRESDPAAEPTARIAALVPPLLLWLQQRHLRYALTARIVESFEDGLAASGRRPARISTPVTIAFVDLTGYTAATAVEGDESAAQLAVRLATLSQDHAHRAGGRVVKSLGDGVLLRFPSAEVGLPAVRDLMTAVEASGLPPAHAGIESGRVVERDGDVFGRTVILAARLSAQAGPGEILVGEGCQATWAGDRATLGEERSLELKGIPGRIRARVQTG